MKKRILSMALAAIMTLCLFPINAFATENVVNITSAEDLKALAEGVNSGAPFTIGDVTDIPAGGKGYTFVQTAEIDLSDYRAGTGWMPIGACKQSLNAQEINDSNVEEFTSKAFKGSYDGKGFAITNLKINSSKELQGLFGMAAMGARLMNVVITDCDIIGDTHVGGLVGMGFANCSVESCSVTGTVKGNKFVGGLGGVLNASTKNCYATGAVNGSGKAGGLIGVAYDKCIERSTVALNPSITGGSAANRIHNVDASYSNDAIADSYAYSGMTVNGNTVTSDDAARLNGADLKISSGKFPADFWTNLGFTAANGWTVPTGAGELPYITGTPNRPMLTTAQKAETHKYEVTILGGGDDATASGEHELYTTVSLDAGTRSGCTFVGWTVESGDVMLSSTSSATTTFTMPDKAVTVKANWMYPVTLPRGNGYTLTPENGSKSPVTEGENYSFKITLDDNYKKDASFAVKANGIALTETNGIYTIKSITTAQTVTVEGVVPRPATTTLDSDSPQTGDTSNMALWIVLLFALT